MILLFLLLLGFLNCAIEVTAYLQDLPTTTAQGGTNISLACSGVSSSPYIYLIEWVCQGCHCGECPSHSDNGVRLLRYNDKITQWDNSFRRTLDKHRYGLEFAPVTVEDTGVYYCLINNQPDLSPVQLIVQDAPEAPSNRPMISSISSRSVLLTWAAPLNDNYVPIISYRIWTREASVMKTNIDTGLNETKFLVTGLKPFTTYSFQVSAENKMGFSVPSKESFQTQTHRERPSGRPTFRRHKISTISTGFNLHWDPPPPTSVNGEFLGYILTFRPKAHHVKKTIEVRDESLKRQNYSLNGLLPHTTYILTLAAKNLEGIGPQAVIELRTEDGVPLQPQHFKAQEISSTAIEVSWRPPSNADILGPQLLGYRLSIKELSCRENCEGENTRTISSPTATKTRVEFLRPATTYELKMLAFTRKREGISTEAKEVVLDTAAPEPPIITLANCTGGGDIMLEWRRPRVVRDRIDFFIIHYKSDLDIMEFRRKIDVAVDNSSDLYVTRLGLLKNYTYYNIAVSAVTKSNKYTGKFYESQLSSFHRVFVSPLCQGQLEFIAVNTRGLNRVVIAIMLAIVATLMLVLAIAACCRPGTARQGYSLVSVLSPTAFQQPSRGWTGEAASDIPAPLFPKHVQGLHASGNMAFVKGFQAFEPHNTDYRGKTNKFADVVDRGSCENYGPVTIDSWRCPCAYVCMVGESLLSNWRAWRNIWENQIELVVTFPQEISKDDLAHFSTSKYVGSYQIQVEKEAVLAAYTARTFKVQHAASTRTVTQLVFNTWPDVGPPENSSFVQFVCEAFSLRQSLQGKVLVYSRSGLDPAIYFMCLDTMLGQMRDTGDTNLSNYIKHLSSRHGLGLSSTELYVDLHDTLAWAIQGGVSAHIQRRIGVSRAV